jgi:hypothetical protein
VNARALKFRLHGKPSDYFEGELRQYDVVYRGDTIGVCDADWHPHPTIPGAEPVKGFTFSGRDGKRGDGTTRAAAVLAAYEEDAS